MYTLNLDVFISFSQHEIKWNKSLLNKVRKTVGEEIRKVATNVETSDEMTLLIFSFKHVLNNYGDTLEITIQYYK